MDKRSTRPKKIVIVGLGLMGGSLAALLSSHRKRQFRIVGISRNRRHLRYAKRRGWIQEGYVSFKKEVLSGAWLIVFSTPVNRIGPLLLEADRKVSPGTLATDVGSVKWEIEKKIAKRLRRLYYVGAHPMVGSHESGIFSARKELYEGGRIFVISNPYVPRKAYREVKAFWKSVSPKVDVVDARTHDRIMAYVSHLPHAVAGSLVRAVRPSLLKHAASGFLDTTRIAQSPATIWAPIFNMNRAFCLDALKDFQRELHLFTTLLERRPSKLKPFLEKASKQRAILSTLSSKK